MISIIIPLYNKEAQIAYTLQSVLNQSYQNFEIIIVNDGSTDNSVAEIERIQDKRIRLIHQANAGVSVARNKGIEEAQYDLIAFLDADDEWEPTYLKVQYNLYQKYPECSVFACNYKFKNANGITSPTIIRKLPFHDKDGILNNYFEVANQSHPPLWTSAIMVKKEAIQTVGGFPNGISSGEDLLTWTRLALNYSIAYTKESLAVYKLDDSYILSNRPSRHQDENDPVGANLKTCYKQITNLKQKKDFKKYLALWHKMRASTSLRYNEKITTIKECIHSLSYNPYNTKVYIFIILSILPSFLKKILVNKYMQYR